MPRNIILLSDGTGNSSLSPFKTNVWRLYQALDLQNEADGRSRQLAFYDSGVGTLGFKPLQVLGGAFGWGLSRNVRQLYENLCRHYQPGDRIYVFGFSRGAFTARILAHFICTCGILDREKSVQGRPTCRMNTDRGLKKGVKRAYKSYRHTYWQEASLWLKFVSYLPRTLRNLVDRWRVLPAADFREHCSHEPDAVEEQVAFVGVWDTVDAVGLPIDELSTVLDKMIYPYKFTDFDFPVGVARGRQALAIDDERHSFHPLLWNEDADEENGVKPDVEQVWFAGAHSNVGGSYPEDGLAYISLSWMIDECRSSPERDGLAFNDESVTSIRQQASALGKIYDSRRGAAVYYRYKPRNVDDLSHQQGQDWRIEVETPRLHHTVLDRIAESKVGYAPSGLPRDFEVVGRDGQTLALQPGDRHYEDDPQRDHRVRFQERARNHIFWRRFTYFFLVGITFLLAITPLLSWPFPGLDRTSAFSKALGAIFDRITGFLPNFLTTWTEAWVQSPGWFIALLAGLAGFYVWSSYVKGNIQELAESGWWHIKGHTSTSPDRKLGVWEALADWYRGTSLSRWLSTTFKRFLLPVGFSVLCLAIVLGAIYRIAVHYPAVSAGACALLKETSRAPFAPDKQAPEPVEPRPSNDFKTSDPCFETDFLLEKGQKYRLDVRTIKDPWLDLTIPASYGGFENGLTNLSPLFLLMSPTKRHLALPWFSLVGEIGRDSGNIFPINRETITFTAPATGRLYLYVNDTVNALGLSIPQNPEHTKSLKSAVAAYRNNKGSAIVTVARVGAGD
ncbi:MAG: DUF2235 domain-containing protein [Pseudomonadota bacterium]